MGHLARAVTGTKDSAGCHRKEAGTHGTTTVETRQLLLVHGADTGGRLAPEAGPIESASETERWEAVAALARQLSGAKDLIVHRSFDAHQPFEAVHAPAQLADEVQALQDADEAVPAEIRAAMVARGMKPR